MFFHIVVILTLLCSELYLPLHSNEGLVDFIQINPVLAFFSSIRRKKDQFFPPSLPFSTAAVVAVSTQAFPCQLAAVWNFPEKKGLGPLLPHSLWVRVGTSLFVETFSPVLFP